MKKLNSVDFYKMLTFAADRLGKKAEEINALNVFPVPDGDTGSNMSMTLSGVSDTVAQNGIGYAAKSAADLMLRSARGNSGVILSVFFRGFAASLSGIDDATAQNLSDALKEGAKAAYGAVMTPTEGTILTVMRTAAEQADGERDIETLFRTACAAAEDALKHTPEQLPLLREAGVVDAGGCGFTVILNAMNMALINDKSAVGFKVPEPGKTVVSAAAACDSEIKYPYCTECIIEKTEKYSGEKKCEILHKIILGAGDSAVWVEDESVIKLHVHTSDPGAVLSEAEKYGSLLTVKIENMRKQHTELNGAETPKEKYGFVAVTNGDGIKDVFRDLGVNEIVSGGQTMNPSTEDLLEAINRVPCRTVFVFPNNSNIILAAQQAAKLVTGRDVRVLPSKSVPQGIAAVCAFDESLEPETNAENMNTAMGNVRTVSATYAVRDAVVNGLAIRKGQFIGLVDNRVRRVADSLHDCIEQLLGELKGMSCVTAYYGSDLTPDDAEVIREQITEELGDNVDVTVISGGQPVYSLILSGE